MLKNGFLEIANDDSHDRLDAGFADGFFDISTTSSVNLEHPKEIIIDGSLFVQRDGIENEIEEGLKDNSIDGSLDGVNDSYLDGTLDFCENSVG